MDSFEKTRRVETMLWVITFIVLTGLAAWRLTIYGLYVDEEAGSAKKVQVYEVLPATLPDGAYVYETEIVDIYATSGSRTSRVKYTGVIFDSEGRRHIVTLQQKDMAVAIGKPMYVVTWTPIYDGPGVANYVIDIATGVVFGAGLAFVGASALTYILDPLLFRLSSKNESEEESEE